MPPTPVPTPPLTPEAPFTGSLAWYDAFLEQLARAEQGAIRKKLADYGLHDAASPFALLDQAAQRLGLERWQVLHTWAARQLMAPVHTLPPAVARARWLDILGYACTALALLALEQAPPPTP